jgi:intracellular proteinase inhibitor BsuPI
VAITLRLRNTGAHPVELHLRGRVIAFDLIVTGKDGEVVWRRLEGRTVPAILQVIELGSGQSLELREVWDQRTNAGAPVVPGHYRVVGTIPADSPRQLSTREATFRILPPNQ